jgi:hypothetical protein
LIDVRASISLVTVLIVGLVAGGCALKSTTAGAGAVASCGARKSDARNFWAQASALQAAGNWQAGRAMHIAAGEYRAQAAMTSTSADYLSRGNSREQAERLDLRADDLRQHGAPYRAACR